MAGYIVAIDQGTTSTRAMVFDRSCAVVATAQQEFPQGFPRAGWVEHDPEDIWRTVVETTRRAMAAANLQASDIAGLGITNQRETTLLWERSTGAPVGKAIVWQDRRTASRCADLKAAGREAEITARTGLVADPYFSASKLEWMLANIDGARARAKAGELAFGTVDSFLLWRLTGGRVHATDATNACRTLLYDIHRGDWDPDLMELFDVPAAVLPEIRDCAAEFGTTEADLFGGPIAIRGVAGDQQAATIGQACFRPGMLKSTYGTGCFALLNTGSRVVASNNRLLTTVAYQLGGARTYALEGAIFVAGAAVQWLRDVLGIIDSAPATQVLAESADPTQEVYLVPAFTGLGAPYWDPDARGALLGLTRNSGPRELARAALESVCYQTRDLLEAMRGDWTDPAADEVVLRVDGGMVANDFVLQSLADVLGVPVDRPVIAETTALGAAYLAGLQSGLYPDPDDFARSWRLDRRFSPEIDEARRSAKYAGWKDAVERTLTRR